jgi:hypothetical protein
MRKLPLLALLLLLNLGCTAIDRMSGVAEVKELQQTGTPAEAVILRIWDTGMTVNEDPVIGMEVEVCPAEGETWNATIPKSLVSRIDIPRFQPGQTIAVRFDPQDRSRVGLDEYRYR